MLIHSYLMISEYVEPWFYKGSVSVWSVRDAWDNIVIVILYSVNSCIHICIY